MEEEKKFNPEEFNYGMLKAGRVYDVKDQNGIVRPKCLITSDKFEPYPKETITKMTFGSVTSQKDAVKLFWTVPFLNNGEISVLTSVPFMMNIECFNNRLVEKTYAYELDAYTLDLITRVIGRTYYDMTRSDYINLSRELHEYHLRVEDLGLYLHMKRQQTSKHDNAKDYDPVTGERTNFAPIKYSAPEIPDYLRGFIGDYIITDVRFIHESSEPEEEIVEEVKTEEVQKRTPVNPVIANPEQFKIDQGQEEIPEISDTPEMNLIDDKDDASDLMPMALKFVSNYDLNTDVRDMSLSSLTGFINDMMLAKSLTEFGQMVGKAPGSIVSKMETASKILIENEVSFRYIPRKSTTDVVEYHGNFVKYAGSDDDRIRSIIKDAYKMYLIDIIMKYDIRTNDELRSVIETIRQRVEKNPEKMKAMAEKNQVVLPTQVKLWSDTEIINFSIDFASMNKDDMRKKYGFQCSQNIVTKMNSVKKEMTKRKLVTGGVQKMAK